MNNYPVQSAQRIGQFKKQKGFTLIELMIVVTIISILAAMAIPAYQDHTTRARLTEGLSMAGTQKALVAEHVMAHAGALPTAAEATALGGDVTVNSANISTINIGANGTITVAYNTARVGAGVTLTLIPAANNGILTWTCTTAGITRAAIRPAGCTAASAT